MSTASFGTFLEFFRELPTARFDSDNTVWKIPKADFEEEREVSESRESAAVTNRGER